jgi:hypothetical protein
VLTLAPLAAHGDEPSQAAAELARSKAVQAQKLFEERDFRAALHLLDDAYATFPSPKMHYNYGLVQRSLLRDAEALESFERFLADAPDADPEKRAVAARHMAELRALVASLEVRSDMDPAEISVDGRIRGTSPWPHRIWISPGQHQVVVKKADVPFPYTERIEAAAGALVVVDARFAPIVAVLQPPLPVRELPPAPIEAVVARPAPAVEPARPVYRRWWFWAAAGTLVASAALSAVVVTSNPSPVCGSACRLGEVKVNAP